MSLMRLIGIHLEIFVAIASGALLVAYTRRALSILRVSFPPIRRRLSRFSPSMPQLSTPSSALLLPGRTRPQTDFGRLRRRVVHGLLAAAGLLTGISGSHVAAGEAWPSFQNGGQVTISAPVPRSWTEQAGVAWKADVEGYGQSSPVVWEGRIYVTSVSGPQKETYHVAAYSLADGAKLWQHDLKNAAPQESTSYVSRAAPTPAVDAGGLVCFFEGGNLLALTHDGKVRWERNLTEEYGAIDSRHGISASVEQSPEAAYIWVERTTEPYVLAISKETGKNLWKVAGAGATSWASPRLVPVDAGKQHLVLSAIGHLIGLDPATGERLWSLDEIAGNSTPTPVPAGEGRFLIGATTGQGAEKAAKANESNGMIGIARSGDGTWKASWLWHAARATSSFGSPIVAGGRAYFVNRTGVLYCLDDKTGEEKYAQRTSDSIWATPVATGDAILLFGKSGVVTAVAAGDSFEKLSESPAWPQEAKPEAPPSGEGRGAGGMPDRSAPVLYGAAIADGKLVLRRGDQLPLMQIS